MKIEVFTDGSATTKDKPGGWAYVLVIDGAKYAECGGHMEGASNNDAEMEAAIQGLAAALKYEIANQCSDTKCSGGVIIEDGPKHRAGACPRSHGPDCDVTLCSDSQLILGWASGRYQFKQVSKIKKYEQLKFLVKRLGVKTEWIEGHSGHEHNERCDKLANEARLGVTRKQDRDDAVARGETLIGTKKSGTLCVWYKNCLKVIDLETNVVEDYKRTIHGPRGGALEIREEKSR